MSAEQDPALDGYAGDPIRDLIEQNHRLTELTRHPGWHVLTALAGDAIEAWQRRMNSGTLSDMGEYKHVAGWLEGARQVLGIPDEIGRRLERAQQREAGPPFDYEDAAAFADVTNG